MHTLDIAPLRSESPPDVQALRYGSCSQGISQFYLHTHTFIRSRIEPHLPLPSQPQLVLIYRSRRDGRLSRPWCEVAQAEIRTRNLPIANPALYHTATCAPWVEIGVEPSTSENASQPPPLKRFMLLAQDTTARSSAMRLSLRQILLT